MRLLDRTCVGFCRRGSGDELSHSPQIAQLAAGLSVPCKTELVVAGEHYYPNIGTLVRHYVCHPEGPDDTPETYTVDVSREVLEDPETLRRDDALAFKTVHSSLDAALRNQIASARPEERVQVALWFAVPRGDLDALGAGAEDVEADALQEAAREELERRLRARAIALRERLHKIPGVVVLSKVDTILRFGAPYIRVEAPASALEAVGEVPGVIWIGEKGRIDAPGSEKYFQGTVTDWLHAAGGDGSLRRVAILEDGFPDYWGNLSGALAGSCGPGYLCHCSWGPTGAHPRQVMSVVRSANLSFGGMAKAGLTLSANTDWTNEGTCDDYAGSNWASAIEWSIENSARIINWSEGAGHQVPSDSGQYIFDRYLDYIASTWPYPFITVITHNQGKTLTPVTWVRNAMVVGGSNDNNTTQRSDDGLFDIAANNGSRSKNPNPYGVANPNNGWELPHIVAPAVNVDVSGNTFLGDQSVTGTSLAAPQVAGIVAGLHELNAELINRPWVVFAGLLASANRNADVALGGQWPLHLNDNFDDFDGAGEVNAFAALAVLQSSSKKDNGNQPASTVGHDYGTMTSTSPPVGTYYSEVWNASVNANDTLRAVAHFQATAQCGTNPDAQQDCDDAGTGDSKIPHIFLYIFDGQTAVGSSISTNNNYQIASVVNGTESPKNFQIKLYAFNWNGVTSTRWGLAWAAGGQD